MDLLTYLLTIKYNKSKIALQSKADHPQTGYADTLVCSATRSATQGLSLGPLLYIHHLRSAATTRLNFYVYNSVTAWIHLLQTAQAHDRHVFLLL